MHGGLLRIHATVPSKDGKGSTAGLTKALGVTPSRLSVIRWQAARNTRVRLNQPCFSMR